MRCMYISVYSSLGRVMTFISLLGRYIGDKGESERGEPEQCLVELVVDETCLRIDIRHYRVEVVPYTRRHCTESGLPVNGEDVTAQCVESERLICITSRRCDLLHALIQAPQTPPLVLL